MLTKEYIARALSLYHRKEYNLDEFNGFTKAAVLVPLIASPEGLLLLLTLRTENVETHKGQISFPGGAEDAADTNAIDTALRETEEELGLDRNTVEILGTLDDHPVPTKFIITPVIGFLNTLPALSLHRPEVAEAFSVPLSFFTDTNNATSEEREFQNRKVRVWHFQYQKYHIWGATAAIIRNLVEILPPA